MNASPKRELTHEYFKNFGLLLICGLSVSNWLIKFDAKNKELGTKLVSLDRQLGWTWAVLEKELHHLRTEGREGGPILVVCEVKVTSVIPKEEIDPE